MLSVTILPILDDNYSYIIQSGNDIAVIDPGESQAVLSYLEDNELTPSFILNTHHHWDHVNGNSQLKKKYALKIIGPQKDKHRIAEMDIGLCEEDSFSFGDETVEIIETPGHTSGHICFYFKESKSLFSGDTLFSLGCGRLFEGTADDLYESFQKIKNFPDHTKVYCGHEYTASNAKFCLSIEPENQILKNRAQEVEALRSKGIPTIPSTLKQEKQTNVFLRAKTPEELSHLRNLKDSF